ncbi:unnamed protein product [Victoria cruziana]
MRRYKNGAVWDFERQMPMSPDGKEVVLGVDGGATSTVCICLEIPLPSQLPDPLPVLGRAVAGCSNHNSVGEASARETLEQVIADALLISNSKRSAVRAVCLAISGVEHPRDEQRILKWLSWAYADQSWARVAELVPTVVASADAGDLVANKILLDSVHELAVSVKAVVQRLGLSGEDGSGSFPLVMVGGVFEANKGWDIAREVINCIRKDYPCADSIRPKIEPAIGAALLAWNLFLDDIGRRS